MLHLNPYSVERDVVVILSAIVVVAFFLGKFGKKNKAGIRSSDYTFSILAASSVIVLFTWVMLSQTVSLPWWNFYFRYTYLGIFPAISMAGYMKEDLFFVFGGGEDTVIKKIGIIFSGIVFFYFLGGIMCFIAIGVYIFQKKHDYIVALPPKNRTT